MLLVLRLLPAGAPVKPVSLILGSGLVSVIVGSPNLTPVTVLCKSRHLAAAILLLLKWLLFHM